MSVKKIKPITPGQRFKVINSFCEVTTNISYKPLLVPNKKSGGRNSKGKMTVKCIGGGHKRKYRVIDFKRNKDDISAVVKTIEYDPNRSSFISLVAYKDGVKSYIITPKGLKVGDFIISGDKAKPETGNVLPMRKIPLGSVISCLEIKPGHGASLSRSAGSFCQLVAREGEYVTVKLPSSETRMLLASCRAMIGAVSNSDHQLIVSGKAGRSRWLGRRPRTRPVVMNPVDHPMGGGEGRASGGHPRSKKGIPAKGYRTRSLKKYSDKYIIERRKIK